MDSSDAIKDGDADDLQNDVNHKSATKICTNCKKEVAAENFVMHETHCARRIVLCPHCREPLGREELSQHIADEHTFVKCDHCAASVTKKELRDRHRAVCCPECSSDVSKCKLDEHLAAMHVDTKCPVCNKVVKKTELRYHQLTECDRRPVACKYCSLECLFSELAAHENYCGSRTEQCTACGQYVMIRCMELHNSSKCQWPEIPRRYDNGGDACNTSFPFSHPKDSTAVNYYTDFQTEDDTTSWSYVNKFASASHPFGPNAFVQGMTGVNGRYPIEENSPKAVDAENGLPCEFCERLLPPDVLMSHQKECKYQRDLASLHPTEHFEHRDRRRNASSADEGSSDEEPGLVRGVDNGNRECITNKTNWFDKKPGEQAFGQRVVTMCDLCNQHVDLRAISDHQEVCYSQQERSLNEFVSRYPERRTEFACQYRFPFAAMSLKQRENFSQHGK